MAFPVVVIHENLVSHHTLLCNKKSFPDIPIGGAGVGNIILEIYLHTSSKFLWDYIAAPTFFNTIWLPRFMTFT
jgi:hypothetical protein